MHGGNLSFFHERQAKLTLAPIYDMLPMQFAPRASGLIPQEVPDLHLSTPPDLAHWQAMLPIAQRYWQRIAATPQPDPSFQAIALQYLERLWALQRRLG